MTILLLFFCFYALNYIIRYQGTLLLLLLFSFAKNWIDSKIELNKQKKNINGFARVPLAASMSRGGVHVSSEFE